MTEKTAVTECPSPQSHSDELPNWVSIVAEDGYVIPLHWHPTQHSNRGVILLVPALGTEAAVYTAFAKMLARSGLSIAVLEQRGQGQSSLRPARGQDWGFKECLQSDLSLSLDWINKKSPDAPIILAGHSLGGLLCIASSAVMPERFKAIVLLACASPYYRNYQGNLRRQLLIGKSLLPLLYTVLGYFPGDLIGFSGKEAKTLMRDWLQLVKYNTFNIRGLANDINRKIESYSNPVLSISFQQDRLAPKTAVQSVNAKLASADLTHLALGEADLGCRAGHYDWVRCPELVVEHIVHWVLSYNDVGNSAT